MNLKEELLLLFEALTILFPSALVYPFLVNSFQFWVP